MVEYLKILKIADNLVKYWGGKLIFVYHPYFTRYLGSYAFQYGGRQYVTFIKDLQNLKIEFIDVTKLYFIMLKILNLYTIINQLVTQVNMVICLQQKGLITFEKKITLINQTKKI